jgi:hypothetical protein
MSNESTGIHPGMNAKEEEQALLNKLVMMRKHRESCQNIPHVCPNVGTPENQVASGSRIEVRERGMAHWFLRGQACYRPEWTLTYQDPHSFSGMQKIWETGPIPVASLDEIGSIPAASLDEIDSNWEALSKTGEHAALEADSPYWTQETGSEFFESRPSEASMKKIKAHV